MNNNVGTQSAVKNSNSDDKGLAATQRGIHEFEQILVTTHSSAFIKSLEQSILGLVAEGGSTWEKLGFSEEILLWRVKCIKLAKLADNFAYKFSSLYTYDTVLFFVRSVRVLLCADHSPWGKLGYDDYDFAECLRRIAERRER
jgi:hypothetical protein